MEFAYSASVPEPRVSEWFCPKHSGQLRKEVSMSHRSFRPIAVPGVLVALVLVGTPASAQTRQSPNTTSAKKWTTPRTPWGDPDLQGSFSNTSENGTPLERPGDLRRPEARRHQG